MIPEQLTAWVNDARQRTRQLVEDVADDQLFGRRLPIVNPLLWVIGHVAAVWAAKRDPFFVEVVRRHVRYPSHLGT